VAATHGVLVHAAVSRLRDLGLRRVLVTDTVAVKTAGELIQVCSIAPTLASAIADLHAFL
jgi:ribose-phosphate pyrophosphokinase